MEFGFRRGAGECEEDWICAGAGDRLCQCFDACSGFVADATRGGQAVAIGITACAFFAGIRAGTGALLRVAAVGRDLATVRQQIFVFWR